MSPDPWTLNLDPWAQYMHDYPSAPAAAATSSSVNASAGQVAADMPTTSVRPSATQQGWSIPGIGSLGSREPFSQAVGLTLEPPPVSNPPSASALQWPTWMYETRRPSMQAPGRPPPSGQGSVAVQRSQVPAIFTQGVVAPPTAEPGTAVPASSASGTSTVAIFSQVHALRAGMPNSRGAAQQEPATSAPITREAAQQGATGQAVTPGQVYQGRATACSVCQEDFAPGDHVGRLSCGHTFHCICLGELAMHSPDLGQSETLQLECPNCRTMASVASSWHYPRLPVVSSPEQSPAAPPSTGEPAVVATPAGTCLSFSRRRMPFLGGQCPAIPLLRPLSQHPIIQAFACQADKLGC